MAGKKTVWWVVGALGLLMVLCCGGSLLGVFTFFKAGFSEAEARAPFATKLLTDMSNANYEYEPVKAYFDESVFQGAELTKLQTSMQLYREKLGKFQKLGAATGFNTETRNSTTIRSYSFGVSFEKGDGTVSIVFKNDEEGKISGLMLYSPLLNK